jgi:phenylpyruvate tautomerase PptA (4-oxalocrotonate tautomerase family)
MDEKQFAEALAAALAPINEKLSAFEAFIGEANTKFEALAYTPEMPKEDEAEMPKEDEESKEDMSAKLAAEVSELKALVANFGAKPVSVAVAIEAKADVAAPANFSEALAVVKAEGLSGSAATKAVIARFPDLYLAARNSGIRNL